VLTLYDAPRCPYCARTRIVLAEKGVPYEVVEIDLDDRPAWIVEKNPPAGRVPVLEEDGWVLPESAVIGEYLDERYPDPPLLPPDRDGRARVRALAEHVNSGIQPLQNAVVLRTLRERAPGLDREWTAKFVGEGLAALERAVNDGQAGRFCHGDTPGLADCYLVPQLYSAHRFKVDVAPFPTLRRIEAAASALAPFQAAHPDRQPDAPPPERRTA
jgi:maleylpyruvate isomerase